MKRFFPITLPLFVFSNLLQAGTMGAEPAHSGVFVGLGGAYNSVQLNQNYTSVGNLVSAFTPPGDQINLNAAGVVGGSMPPFQSTTATFSPEGQIGYFNSLPFTAPMAIDFWGFKYSYQYLGISTAQQNVINPLGRPIGPIGPIRNLDIGNMFTQSVQNSIDHEMTLLAFIGHTFKSNKRVYLGGGAALFGTTSNIYNTYGVFNTTVATVFSPGSAPNPNNHFSSTSWVWGGAGQVGFVYGIGEYWSLDLNYTYAATGNVKHNDSGVSEVSYDTPVGGDILPINAITNFNLELKRRITVQSLNFTINRTFQL